LRYPIEHDFSRGILKSRGCCVVGYPFAYLFRRVFYCFINVHIQGVECSDRTVCDQ